MKYQIGDKVTIVSQKIGTLWNPQGEMDKWLGQDMTIRDSGIGCYKMMEDRYEGIIDGWNWTDYMIAGLACKVGDRIKILKCVGGCIGAEGYTGIITEKTNQNGLFASDFGINVDCGSHGIWRINRDARFKILTSCLFIDL